MLTREHKLRALKFNLKAYGYYEDKEDFIRVNPYGYDYHIKFLDNNDVIIWNYLTITDCYELYKGPFDYLAIKELLNKEDIDGKIRFENLERRAFKPNEVFMSMQDAEFINKMYEALEYDLFKMERHYHGETN